MGAVRSYADLPDSLTVEADGALRVLTLNRPEARNAFDGPMHHAFAEVWQLIAEDDEARCVLIRAAGTTFSAGGDYAWFRSQLEDPAEQELALRDGHRILDRLLACRVPVVTAVQGGAVGLGASIGVLSDLVVMSEDAFYRDTHVALGMTAGDGAVAWPLSVGMQVAKQHVLLGDRLPAAEAHRLGMVNAVVPAAELDATARSLAVRLAALPAIAAQSTKRAFNLQYEQQLRPIAEFALAWERLSLQDPGFRATVQGL